MKEKEIEFKKWLYSENWTFAKSMKSMPHDYIVKKNNNRAIFEDFVMYIREYGYRKYFLGKIYIYYDIDGYKYWTMGDEVEKTIILNRARIE